MGKNIFVLLFRKVIGALVSMLCTTLIIKNISIGDYGIYTVFLNTIAMFSTFATLGVDSSSAFVLQNKKYSKGVVIVNIVSAALLMVILSGIFTFYYVFNFNSQDLSLVPQQYKIFIIVATMNVLFCNIMFAIVMGNMDFKNYSIFTIVPNLVLLIALYIFKIYYSRITLQEAVLFYTLGYSISSIVILLFTVIKYKLLKNIKFLNLEVVLYIFKYGIQAYLSNVITFLNLRINIFIIGYYLGVQKVGLYSTCLIIIDLIWLLASTLSSITYPLFSNPSNIVIRQRILPIVTRSVLILTLIASIGFYILSKPLITLLFGENFLEIRSLLLILFPGVILLAGAKILAADFTAQGKPKFNIFLNFAVLIVTVITNFILVPILGLAGAALATSISFTVYFILCITIYCSVTKTNYLSYLVPKFDDIKQILSRIK